MTKGVEDGMGDALLDRARLLIHRAQQCETFKSDIWHKYESFLVDSLMAPEQPSMSTGDAAALRDSLWKLSNEASGFLAMADRNTHGNTNMAVLKSRIDDARALLETIPAKPSLSPEMEQLLRQYRRPEESHEFCVNNKGFPNIYRGEEDDRCPICKLADTLLDHIEGQSK